MNDMDKLDTVMRSDKSGTANNTDSSTKRSHLDVLSDANNLFDAFYLSQQGSSWKSSVQRCEMNLLKVINSLQSELRSKTYHQAGFTEFVMSERGKIRPIRSLRIKDRIVQRALCDKVLLPLVRPKLIYDNGASLANRGISFSRKRIKVHLEKFIRNHGTNGYILLLDFSKFFDNISHDNMINVFKKVMRDNSIDWLIEQIIRSFRPDVSYMDDDEFQNAENDIFDSMKQRARLHEFDGRKKTKFLNKSLGIGSQISQIGGIFYPSQIDNFFKCVKGFKYYGRYMDDLYIIHEDREKLIEALNEFKEQSDILNMHVNLKKVTLIKITSWFIYLKVKHKVNSVNGSITTKLHKDTFNRERRRLKKLYTRLINDKINFSLIYSSYISWRGNVIIYPRNRANVEHTNKLFLDLFCTKF